MRRRIKRQSPLFLRRIIPQPRRRQRVAELMHRYPHRQRRRKRREVYQRPDRIYLKSVNQLEQQAQPSPLTISSAKRRDEPYRPAAAKS